MHLNAFASLILSCFSAYWLPWDEHVSSVMSYHVCLAIGLKAKGSQPWTETSDTVSQKYMLPLVSCVWWCIFCSDENPDRELEPRSWCILLWLPHHMVHKPWPWNLLAGGIWESLKMRVRKSWLSQAKLGLRGSLEGQKADRNVESKYCALARFLLGMRIPLRVGLEAICVHSGKELAYILSMTTYVGLNWKQMD